jgi:hypothetical protein
MSSVPLRRPRTVHRLLLALTTLLLAVVLGVAGMLIAAPARAASQGSGFGTWAPLSAYGWHGSMLVHGVHTYCILPGLPAPTGPTQDHGVRGDAGGLSAQQLAGINLLVSTYGQTGDAVQAAAVGWAVKAIANRDHTLHAWGYRGDSLAGAVHWTFDRLAPAHAATVAERAEAYYAEGMAVTVPGSDARIALATDAADPRRGSVRVDGGAGTAVTVTLQNAVFADTGAAELSGAPTGVDIAILASPPSDDGAPFTVQARAHLSASFAPAVRYFTTPGQQDTAGPAGGVEYTVEATDAAPRPVDFSPGITTRVAAPEVAGGRFVDDVTLTPVEGVWPKQLDGSFVPLTASATVYRTDGEPAQTAEIPEDAEPVGELSLVTDPAQGGGTYRVQSEWELPGPGVYTAVWRIRAADQVPEVAAHLERDYVWSEEFGVPSQMTRVPTPVPPPVPEIPGIPEVPVVTPPTLAATGPWAEAPRVAGAGLATLLFGGALLAHLAQRRRRDASAGTR